MCIAPTITRRLTLKVNLATHFMHSESPTNKAEKNFLSYMTEKFSTSQKSKEARRNAITHSQSNPIPKFYILWMGWDWGWVMACCFAFLRGGVWQAITKSLQFFFCSLALTRDACCTRTGPLSISYNLGLFPWQCAFQSMNISNYVHCNIMACYFTWVTIWTADIVQWDGWMVLFVPWDMDNHKL